MNKLRPSTVALLVSAALSSTAASASLNHAHSHTLSNFDHAAASQFKANSLSVAAREQALAERATTTGLKSHFDAKMGKATFLWAPKGQSKPNLSMIAPEHKNAYAASYYLNSLTGFSSEENAVNRAQLAYIHDTNKGPLVAKYRQQLNGVAVFNKEYNIVMDREHNLVAGSGYLGNKVTAAQALQLFGSFSTPEAAVLKAIADLSGGKTQATLNIAEKKGDYILFDATTTAGQQVVGQPRAKQVFYDINGELVAAHYVEVKLAHIENPLDSVDYGFVVGNTGKVLFRNNLISHASESNNAEFTYRVWAEADGFPYEGPHGDVIPALVQGNDTTEYAEQPLVTVGNYSKISTDDPWLTADDMYTYGNNVLAYADVVAPQGYNAGDIIVSTTSDMTFDYPFDETQRANSFVNRQSAVVNMFVVNNFMHDWWYDHGFDEAAGNAQLDNYGRGGVEGDPLEVQAQDYSGLNNANMSTPADGGSPRMQQYLYTSKDAVNGVDQGINIVSHPGSLGVMQSTQLSSFGPQQYTGVSANLRRLHDDNAVDSGSEFDGCEAAVNGYALEGRIAIIDRGSCAFTQKVLNAQAAGAIGAIVVNNVDDGTPAPMGGTDTSVTIPNLGLNYEEGQALYARMAAGQQVTAEIFSKFPLKDSSFDNGIIAHEWGHYISNRLVGNASGLINFQGRSMGEGWGDFHSLMLIVKAEDGNIEGNEEWQLPFATGTYVEDFYTGIRRAPYSTNMDINPLTFEHITAGAEVPGLSPTNGDSPHGAGEMWAAVLWDVYASLLNMYEFDEAQSRMADYLVAGYKATPIAPTYTEARDAILSVMLANSADDFNAAVTAFARRGMGFGAVSPERFSDDNSGVTESYATQIASYSASDLALSQDGLAVCTADDVLDAGETANVSFSIMNNGSEVLSGITAQVQVLSDHDVTLANDGMVTFGEVGLFEEVSSGDIAFTLNSAGTGDTIEFGVTFPELVEGDEIVEPADLSASVTVNYDFVKLALDGSSAVDNMETLATLDNFKENVMYGGDAAIGTQGFDTVNIGFFQAFNPDVDLGTQAMYLNNNAFQSDVAVETDMVEVAYGQDFSINFWHFYWLEEAWDGGVVEISINGGAWMDVLEAGGTFAVGYNYDELIENSSQALQGRPVFTGINGDLATFNGNMESISFGDALNGQTVQFRFRISSDFTANEFGWVIDNVEFTNIETSVFSEVVAGDAVSCD
ncbi:M36 family metallopeptidase [Planctobacterium marinum]|uniref:M36 family metallopeptidase n=1 Tax=Planctobacterium marinum TaxID=1631968 RepID=UPI001E619FF0|nr:M36 family metallopeptidase [Planctobacterium marinum]MCC2606679.1 M36 family metallopeptidase [Planctobacterium marinum]